MIRHSVVDKHRKNYLKQKAQAKMGRMAKTENHRMEQEELLIDTKIYVNHGRIVKKGELHATGKYYTHRQDCIETIKSKKEILHAQITVETII